jgi:hypothetical protein
LEKQVISLITPEEELLLLDLIAPQTEAMMEITLLLLLATLIPLEKTLTLNKTKTVDMDKVV